MVLKIFSRNTNNQIIPEKKASLFYYPFSSLLKVLIFPPLVYTCCFSHISTFVWWQNKRLLCLKVFDASSSCSAFRVLTCWRRTFLCIFEILGFIFSFFFCWKNLGVFLFNICLFFCPFQSVGVLSIWFPIRFCHGLLYHAVLKPSICSKCSWNSRFYLQLNESSMFVE